VQAERKPGIMWMLLCFSTDYAIMRIIIFVEITMWNIFLIES